MLGPATSHHSVSNSFSPSFSKLEEWLENLLMHLDIGLPLLSELDQLSRTFWHTHKHQKQSLNQIMTLSSHEQKHSPKPQSPVPKQSDDANNHQKPNHLTQTQDKISTSETRLDGEQLTHDPHEMRIMPDPSYMSQDHAPDNSQRSCKSTYKDSGKDRSETYELNLAGQPIPQHEPLQPLQVDNSLPSPSNKPKRICSVLWNRTTEDSSFL